MTRRAIIPIVLGSVWLFGAEGRVKIIDNEVYIEEAGILRQLTRNGERKATASLSPKGTKVVYQDYKHQYESEGKNITTLTILDTGTGMIEHKIPIPTSPVRAALWDSQWLNERIIWTADNYYLYFIDAEKGKVIHVFWPGDNWSFSPDQEKMILKAGKPRGSSATLPDVVLLALVNKGSPLNNLDSDGEPPVNATAMEVYPEVRAWGEWKSPEKYSDENDENSDENHYIALPVWSPNSQKVAFVEYYKRTFWAVVLNIVVNGDRVKIGHKKVSLGNDLAVVKVFPSPYGVKLEWMPNSQAIRLETSKDGRKIRYLVDVETNQVVQIQ